MIPEQAPFDLVQRARLEELLSTFDERQRFWLSGYLASSPGGVAVPVAAAAGPVLWVLYGTESGNCEQLADRAVKEAKRRGYKAVMKNMSDVSVGQLEKVAHLLVVVSTWGDGEPPETASTFYKELMTSNVKLGATKFSVCALGDTSYEKFCQTGKEVDARLETMGGSRVFARQDCDVDYEDGFQGWLGGALDAFGPVAGGAVAAVSAVSAVSSAYGKKNPYPAELLESVLLNGKGSSKETWHLEFSLAGSGMAYEPGDALAVQTVNAPDVVGAVLAAAKVDGAAQVGGKTLFDALCEDFDITALSRAVLTKLAAVTGSPELQALLVEEAKENLKQYIEGRQIVDALEDFAPKGLSAAELTGILRKLPVRLYSIASSPLAHPDEVHLTVAAVRYESHGRARKGACSTYLADLVKPGDAARVFVQPNKHFRLPASEHTPVIMVGPGTGIAPFRAFVEHRAATGAKGPNWLIMGDQHYLYDFLYQLEWQDHLKSGVLTKLDVAFSRDQPEKVYVQHKLREHAKDVYAWLQQGAHFYVCGDASHMAKEVHDSLVAIVQGEGGMSTGEAEEYVEQLKKSGRYQRDVY
jgi:sulfite reductase (NADPH) flavoprotein alpha-component